MKRKKGAHWRFAARATCAMTHQEIADLLGVSRARVQQIENRALAKLRRWMGEEWRP